MEYVKLGNTGMDVSPICLGCMSFGAAEGWVHNKWALDEEDSRSIIKRALDLGVNFFESLIPEIGKESGRITAAETTGPAKGPRPASSIPAILE